MEPSDGVCGGERVIITTNKSAHMMSVIAVCFLCGIGNISPV